MANEEYLKETFKPDKLWACPSITGSTFEGITPPAEGGGGIYQIGEDLNFTLGAYFDYEIPGGTVNGDALYNAEYKAGAYVVNKGYIFNYIGDSGYYHVFVNVRNTSALPSMGSVQYTAVDIACEILAFQHGTPTNPDEGVVCVYTCMPRGTEIDEASSPTHKNIKVNGVEFYSGLYVKTLIPQLYKHRIRITNLANSGTSSMSIDIIDYSSIPYSYSPSDFAGKVFIGSGSYKDSNNNTCVVSGLVTGVNLVGDISVTVQAIEIGQTVTSATGYLDSYTDNVTSI